MSIFGQCVLFGRRLIDTEDLDPVYCAITNTDRDIGISESTLHRLLVAYWCFYHLGASARLAEVRDDKEFWARMEEAAVNQSNLDGSKPWPRGAERRHFRGQQAIHAVSQLRQRPPSKIIEDWFSPPCTFQSVVHAVKQSRGFGPWIAFKVADMGERVLPFDVDFTDCDLGFYGEPRAGAALVDSGGTSKDISPARLRGVISKVNNQLPGQKNRLAPPTYDRALNVQEVETVLCKFKSSLGGHYYVGKDIREVRHGLGGWGDLAQELLNHMPKEVQ